MITVHHIGYLVKKIEKAKCQFERLGFQRSKSLIYDEGRDADIIFMGKDGYLIELVSPRSDRSVVSRLIKTYKNSPYHICYRSSDFENDLIELQRSGFTCIDEPCSAPALDGKRVCFLMSPYIGLIELLEMR